MKSAPQICRDSCNYSFIYVPSKYMFVLHRYGNVILERLQSRIYSGL